MSITDLEKLYDHDRHWIYRAIAAQQAENLAQPIRRQHDEQRAKEAEQARKDAAIAAKHAGRRQAWRDARALDAIMTEAD